MNAITKTYLPSISTVCPTCDGDGVLLCGVCRGGGTREYPCRACDNSGGEPCNTCHTVGEVDPLAPLYRHSRFKKSHCSCQIIDGVLHLRYVRAGESLIAKFREVQWAEAFLDKLDETPNRAINRRNQA